MKHFLHEVSALFHIKGRRLQVSVPCYMTFHAPTKLRIEKAWFNPDTQKIEIEGVVEKPPEKERVAFSSVFISGD